MKLRKILWPFSLVYDAVTRVRNLAFDRHWLPSRSFDIPVIAVGNLSTGGTGKTPMVEFLIDGLQPLKLAMVSRGYGRKTKGPLIASAQSTVSEIGDEPFQVYRKFPHIALVVSEKRAEGINLLLKESSLDAIILDDAFQHRYVQAGLSILLSTYYQPFYRDRLLPAGNLRESSKGRHRADIIVITKCPPALSPAEANEIRKNVKLREGQYLFFSTLNYGKAISSASGQYLEEDSPVVALSGIARPAPFIREVESRYQLKRHLNYRDHHNFSSGEIWEMEEIIRKNPEWNIITTEKDWVRMEKSLSASVMNSFFYLPVETRILFDEEEKYRDLINNYIRSGGIH